MSSSAPLRLDAELVRMASAAARLHKRTLPRQIEYWAEIGRAVEKRIAMEDLLAVREGFARLVVETGAEEFIDPDDVFEDLETMRGERRLGAAVSRASFRYQSCPGRPGLLERIAADGHRTLGRFHDGEFVSIEQ